MDKFQGNVDVMAIGEPLALIDPVEDGPLEHVNHFRLRVAGAELNTLIGLARLGHRTAFVSAVGDDPFGRRIRQTLVQEGIDDHHLATAPEPSGIFFKERLDGRGRRVYYYRNGSAASRLSVQEALTALDAIKPRFLIVSGVTLGLGENNGLGDAARALIERSSDLGCRTVFDANLRPGIWNGKTAREEFRHLVHRIHYLLAGSRELETLAPGDPEHATQDLIERGVKAVFVKYGADGSVVHTIGRSHPIPAESALVVDTIGAGDAFAAGVVSGLLRGWGLVNSASLGSTLGAYAVSGTGDWECLPEGDMAVKLVERHSPTSSERS